MADHFEIININASFHLDARLYDLIYLAFEFRFSQLDRPQTGPLKVKFESAAKTAIVVWIHKSGCCTLFGASSEEEAFEVSRKTARAVQKAMWGHPRGPVAIAFKNYRITNVAAKMKTPRPINLTHLAAAKDPNFRVDWDQETCPAFLMLDVDGGMRLKVFYTGVLQTTKADSIRKAEEILLAGVKIVRNFYSRNDDRGTRSQRGRKAKKGFKMRFSSGTTTVGSAEETDSNGTIPVFTIDDTTTTDNDDDDYY